MGVSHLINGGLRAWDSDDGPDKSLEDELRANLNVARVVALGRN